MTNVARFAEDAIDRFGDYESAVQVSLTGPDTVHRSGDLHRTGLRLASALVDLGVRPGDRVMVMVPNTAEITSLYAGITRCGAVVLPVLFLLGDAEVRHILQDAEPTVVVTSSELVDRIGRAAAEVDAVKHVLCLDAPGPEGTRALPALLEDASEDSPLVDRADDDLALLIYTGGTTGRPRGVMLTHGNVTHAGRMAAMVSAEENGLGPDDVSCSALPMSHSYGVLVWLVTSQVGGRSVLLRWFEATTWFRCVERYGVTTSPMVPTMLTHLLNQPDADSFDTSSLRYVTSGASPLPPDVGRAFEDRFRCAVLEGWGLTESAGVGTLNRLTRRRWGSIGLPATGVELSIRDRITDEELPHSELGEICIRGPHVMAGYWNLSEETSQTLRGGWLHTGDLGHVDEDGFVFLADRVGDLIIRGGFNVYPRDVEEVLHAHPAVLEAAVVGVPDQAMGEEIKAFVVLRPGTSATEQELLEHCRGQLAKYKCPRSVTFLDTLPKSGVGKILRRELREGAARSGR